jgi:hypothetical protein
MEQPTQLACKFCGKPAKSKSGLTNHEKICKLANNSEVSPVVSAAPVSSTNPYDRTVERAPERHNSNGSKAPSSRPGFQFGAFLVMTDYIPILLDVDFCIALGNFILEHGSANSAIMAFAHQLNKLDDE